MTNIPTLFSELIAEIYSYLEPRDRSNGLLVCKLFQRILDSPKYDHKLWPRDRLRLISVDDAKIPLVKRVFHRLLLGKEIPRMFDSLTSCENWPQFVIRDNLLVASSILGETKVWNLETIPPSCTHTIPPFNTDEHSVKSTVLGNWLVRYLHIPVGDGSKFVNRVEVLTLDHDGRAQEIFSQEFGAPFVDMLKPHLITPIRYRNSFYLSHTFSREVQVWSLENKSFSHKRINPPAPLGDVITLKEITEGELLVMYDRSNVLHDLKNDIQMLTASEHSIGRYAAYLNRDGSMKIADISFAGRQTSICLKNSQNHNLYKPFAIDGDWLAVGAEQRVFGEYFLGIFLYNLKDAKNNCLSEYGYIPLKAYNLWPWNDWPHLLEWPFFVHAGLHESRVYVYCLWDLKKNDKDEAVPSYTIELPENCQVVSIHRHGTSIYVATFDHQIWKIC